MLLLSGFIITNTVNVRSLGLLKFISNIKSIGLKKVFCNLYTAGTIFLKYFPLPSEKNLARNTVWAFYTHYGINAVIPGRFLNAS